MRTINTTAKSLALLALLGFSHCGTTDSTDSPDNTPQAAVFNVEPVDTFIVDLENPAPNTTVTRTSPYFGENSACPHTGAHVHFQYSGTGTYDCVPITAPFAATIDEVDNCKNVGTSDGFQINLRFANEQMSSATFEMSIESQDGFHCAEGGDDNFYSNFIYVDEGQSVAAGEIIACLPVFANGNDSAHIHYNLRSDSGSMACPNIFTQTMTETYATYFDPSGFPCEVPSTSTFCYEPGDDEDLTGLFTESY